MVTPPSFFLVAPHARAELIPIRVVRRHVASEVFAAALQTVNIARGQAKLIQPRPVHWLDDQIQPPKVSLVLVAARTFFGAFDHAKMYPMRVGGRHSGQLIRTESQGLVHPSHPTIHLHPWTGA